MTPSTKLVFFGNEKLATGLPDAEPVIRHSLQAAGYEIEAVVTSKEVPPHQSKLAVLAAYGKILPQGVLDQFPLGIINVHPSLLPIHRGPTPIEQAILDGLPTTGVTIMRLAAKMDAGPVYAQQSIKLAGQESKLELAGQLQKIGADLLREVLPQIVDGSAKPKEQDASILPTYSKMIKKADGQIDWAKPATQIEREIRAYLGWPGSWTKLAELDVAITSAHAVPTNHPDSKPGDVEGLTDVGVIMVECGQGNLCIQKLKPAGKREMTAKEFLAGHKL